MKKKKGWSWDYNFCFGGESTKLMIRFLLHLHTHIPTQCSWHGELIKMMFSLRGALRFFALLWLFNLLFAMLVIAFTHSSLIFRNGSSNSHTNTHTAVPLWHMEFLHFYGFILSLKPFPCAYKRLETPITISKKKRRKSAVMSASGK
jgi:hypothetical protein